MTPEQNIRAAAVQAAAVVTAAKAAANPQGVSLDRLRKNTAVIYDYIAHGDWGDGG